jgi:superfamily II DNA or RNA helicase
MPTGSGKTVIFSMVAKELHVKTLVIAHSEELLAQAANKFRMIWPEATIGFVQGENDDTDAMVVIASIQTASRSNRLQKLIQQDFRLLIIDECHHSTAPSYKRVIEELGFMTGDRSKLLLGVSATLKRSDGVGLGDIFEKIVFQCSLAALIRGGYLCSLTGRQIVTKIDLRNVGTNLGDFVTGELSRAINTRARNDLIVKNFKEFAADRNRVVAFCADVAHSIDLASSFNESGIPAAAIYGAMDDDQRKQTLADFASGKIQILCNCAILVEGFDQEDVDCIILGRPTKSEGRYLQMVGRGCRLHPAKQNCLILDFADNCSRHSICSFKNSLDGAISHLFDDGAACDVEEDDESSIDETQENRAVVEAPIFVDNVKTIEFFDRSVFSWNKVGSAWHLTLGFGRDVWLREIKGGFAVVAHFNGKVINLSDRPLSLSYAISTAESWCREQPDGSSWAQKSAPWRSEPATQKQLDTLARNGFSFGHGVTKGQAAELLDTKFNAAPTPKQLFYLKVNGIKYPPGITKFQARDLIAKEKKIV